MGYLTSLRCKVEADDFFFASNILHNLPAGVKDFLDNIVKKNL